MNCGALYCRIDPQAARLGPGDPVYIECCDNIEKNNDSKIERLFQAVDE